MKKTRRKYRVWSGPRRWRQPVAIEQVQALLRDQGGRCWVCRRQLTLDEEGSVDRGRVDRCARTGRIRGVLCARCSSGLGSFDDDVHRLGNAIRYVAHFQSGVEVEEEFEGKVVVPTPTGSEYLDEMRRNPERYVTFSSEMNREVDAILRSALKLQPEDRLPPPVPLRESPRKRASREEGAVLFRTSWGEEIDLADPGLVARLETDAALSREIDAYIEENGRRGGGSEDVKVLPRSPRSAGLGTAPGTRSPVPDDIEQRMATIDHERKKRV